MKFEALEVCCPVGTEPRFSKSVLEKDPGSETLAVRS
jgi:hypothetical protein